MKCSAKEVNIPLKRFENKRCVLLAVLVFLGLLVVAAATILVMIFLGWRFTYQPELDNKWDAISAVATWAGVVVAVASTTASFLAVWFAIRVPKKIAEQQNKIALFEMRHEVFDIYNLCKVFSEILRWAVSEENVQAFFLNVFCNEPLDKKNINKAYVGKEVATIFEKLRRTQFLFGTNVSSYIKRIDICFYELMSISLYAPDEKKLNEKIHEFIELMDTNQYQAVLDEMGNDLKLK